MAAACCRSLTSLPTSWSARCEGELAVHLDGGSLARRFALRLRSPRRSRLWRLPSFACQRNGSEPPRRMRALVLTIGEEAIFAVAGLSATSVTDLCRSRTPQSPIGLISLRDQARGAFGVGLPFGRIEAEALRKLADLFRALWRRKLTDHALARVAAHRHCRCRMCETIA